MAVLSLFAALAGAQATHSLRKEPAAKPPASSAGATVLRKVNVEGLKRYSADQVLPILGLRPGQTVAPADFERARDRLLATGFFESIGWRYEPASPNGLDATFMVTEPEQFLPWILDRVPVTPDELAAGVRSGMPLFGKLIPPSDAVLARVAKTLERLAAAKGVTAPMAGRVTLLGKDQMTVVFGPKSPPPNIAEVRFRASRVIEPRYLVKAMADLAIGTPFFEPNFRFLLDNQIRPLYEAIGHLRVRFPTVTAQKAQALFGVSVTVDVDEGPAYNLESIVVRGTPLSDDEIQEEGQFKVGEPASFSEIGKGLNRILDRLRTNGHMKADYKAGRRLNDEKKTVEIFVDVDAGPVYRFEALEIKGLDLESEPVIRKLWTIKPGEPYRGGYAESFVQRIREMDLFDNLGDIKPAVTADEKTQSVRVLLNFLGEKPKPARKQPF